MKSDEILRVARIFCAQISNEEYNNIHVYDASDIHVQTVCSLWAGMGHIYKVTINPPTASKSTTTKSQPSCFILKHVAPPRKNLSLGDQRKASSYQVEANFYENVASLLIRDYSVYVPIPYHIERHAEKSENELIIAMSYVEESSFADRPLSNSDAVRAVLRWLAAFHASYWGTDKVNDIVESAGLQPQGSYWYLDTRPDEYDAMPRTGWQGRLKRAARAIDSRLKRDPLQCLIHGDVKEANVLYSVDTNAAKTSDITPSLSAVATMATVTMCDFQYCGKGPPTKDLAYFLCSSANVIDEVAAVEYYLEQLTMRLTSDVEVPSLDELQESLDIAFCDFYRFMSGWGFWGSGGEDRVKAVLNRLDGGKDLGSEEFYDEAMKRVYS